MRNFGVAAISGGFIIMSQYGTNRIGNWYYDECKNNKLFDIGHKILPHISSIPWLSDILIFVLFPFIYKNKQFWSEILSVLILRALTIIPTILPKCHHEQKSCDGILGIINGQYDKIFSGHMSYVFIATRVLKLNKLQFYTLNILQALIILSTRTHYTVDVILGIIISELIHRSKIFIFK